MGLGGGVGQWGCLPADGWVGGRIEDQVIIYFFSVETSDYESEVNLFRNQYSLSEWVSMSVSHVF